MNNRTIADMAKVIRDSCNALPWQPEVIAGVHKSGLLAATMFGARFNVPIVPLRQLWEADWVYSGIRGRINEKAQNAYLSKPRRILIVEDAANTGKTIERQLKALNARQRAKHTYFKVVVFGTKSKVPQFDRVLDVCPGPRIFEWNWRDHKLLENSILDIDGVLCPDPPTPEERTGPYIRHIETAKPLYVPRKPVLALATARLEKYRPHTIVWLAKNGIEYGTLHMAQYPNPAARRKAGNWVGKASTYAASGAILFVESHDRQAAQIAKGSKRPVFSIESGSMF